MSVQQYNFRFKRTEIRVLSQILSASGIAQDTFQHILHSQPLFVGEADCWELRKSILKSLSKLLSDLDCNPSMREVGEEQKLFETPESDCYRAILMVERIRLLYSSVNFPFPELANTSLKNRITVKYIQLLLEWCILYHLGKAEKLAKYQSVSMFNKVMNVEPLESIHLPFGWCLGSLTPFGKMHHKVQKLIIKSSLGEKLRLAQCFLYFKKGCPPASSAFIEETMKKHKCALTSQAPPIDTLSIKLESESILVVPRASIKQRVEKVVYEVFKNYKAPETLWEPSRNACYQKSRTRGGQMSEINFFASGWAYQITAKGVEYLPIEGSDNWEFFDTGYSFIKVPIVTNPILKDVSRSIYAKPIALTEPLKVRVITCEDAWSTYCLTGAQKGLWSCLHQHHWFALTGRPVNASDVPVDPTKDWISVDYSAATDNLSSEFSRLVIRSICDLTGLPFQLCYDSLCNHLIMYPEKDSKGRFVEEERQQTNGQLMGSILSFIVLCICNAVVVSLAVNPGSFDPNTNFLINGDDGLFLGGDIEYSIWKNLSSHCGLSPSIGKVYRSREFCVINSTCFVTVDGLVRECAYPNCSGMMQFDARTYTKPKGPLDLKDSLSLWLSGFDNIAHRSKAESLWYSTFNSILNTEWVRTFSIDWYLPQSLGGLGLPINELVKDRPVCREALARARWCLDNMSCPWRKRQQLTDRYGQSVYWDYYADVLYPESEYGEFPEFDNEFIEFDRPEITNPFVESTTWLKCYSTRAPSDKVYEDLRHLGWSKHVEVGDLITEDYVTNYFNMLVPHLGDGGSAVSLSLLNGINPCLASRSLETTYVDYVSDLSQLRKSKRNQSYWENYREISASSFQFLTFVSGSRKLQSWKPKIPQCDPILDQHYHKWLEGIQQKRIQTP